MLAPFTLAPLARLSCAVERSGWTGEIMFAGGACARIAGGRIAALDGFDTALLGDVLRLRGAMREDSDAARRLAARSPRGPRVGALLIAAGLTTGAAVEHALRVQLEQRLCELVRSGRNMVGLRALCARASPSYSVSPTGALWRATLRTLDSIPEAALATLSGSEALRLTDFGDRWFENLTASAQERVQRAALDGALAAERAEQARCNDARTLPLARHTLRAGLRVLGVAAEAARSRPAGYALLARKRRELARRAEPAVLLEVKASGHAARRKAIRLLAAALHPDRFASDHPCIHALANETLCALLDAERTLA